MLATPKRCEGGSLIPFVPFLLLSSYFPGSAPTAPLPNPSTADWLAQTDGNKPAAEGHVSSESLFELLSYFRRFDSQFFRRDGRMTTANSPRVAPVEAAVHT